MVTVEEMHPDGYCSKHDAWIFVHRHLIETVENSFPICFKIKSKQKSLCKLYISMLPRFEANLSVFRIDENS